VKLEHDGSSYTHKKKKGEQGDTASKSELWIKPNTTLKKEKHNGNNKRKKVNPGQ
jgi:hypothetical protein